MDNIIEDSIENYRRLSDGEKQARHQELMKKLSELTEKEQKVLRLRFGLDDGEVRAIEEVAQELDMTRERIRQIEAKALRKLRHPTQSKSLKDYLQ